MSDFIVNPASHVEEAMRGTVPLILTLALFSCGSPAPEPAGEDPVTAPDAEVEITEWPVPWADTTPRDPYVGPQNHVWFVGQGGDYIASFDPTTADFTHFDLDPGTGPHNLIVDDDGSVWYAGNRAAHIGKLDPESGEITKFPMPDPAAGDPHTLVFDQNGDIWFTVQAGNFVGKLWPRSGEIQLIPVPTEGARPYGIVIDSNNRPWIVEFGVNKIATVDPDTMTLEEITLPRPETRPRRLAVTSDDKIWYVDYGQGFLGRLDGVTHEIEEWPVPAGSGALAYAMAVDDRDRLWFVESGPQPNRLVGFDPATSEFFSITEIESGGGTVRHMYFDERSREIWFGTDTNYIGRARLKERST
jgi:virginiamycin B lyase